MKIASPVCFAVRPLAQDPDRRRHRHHRRPSWWPRSGSGGRPPRLAAAHGRRPGERRFRDRARSNSKPTSRELQASVARIEHHERPEYLDRSRCCATRCSLLDHLYMSLFSTVGWVLRLGDHGRPARRRSIPRSSCWPCSRSRGAHVDLAAGGRAPAEERGAPPNRLARHLFTVGTTAAARQGGARHRHRRRARRRRRRGRGKRGMRRVARARWVERAVAHARRGRSSARPTSARSCSSPSGLDARPATCCSCSPPARALAVHRRDGRRDRLPARHLARRLAAPGLARGLRRVARSTTPTGRCPSGSHDGIRFEHVSFALPRHRAARARRRRRSTCPPARSSRSSARTAPARRRS